MDLKPVRETCSSFTGKEGIALVPMKYSTATIQDLSNLQLPPVSLITGVELWYTDFQESETFSQPGLNRERFEVLEKLIPGITEEESIEWKISAQSGMKNKTEAENCFHGFVIHYISLPEYYSAEEELLIMDSLQQLHDEQAVSYRYSCDTIMKKRSRTIGYRPVSKQKQEKGIIYKSKGIWNRKRIKETYYDTSFVCDSTSFYELPAEVETFFRENLHDTSLLNILERNSWENAVVVTDVTGSMSLYTFQVLYWNRLAFNDHRITGYTFFNDGDETPEFKKIMGSTGGIYHVDATSLRAIDSMMFTAMNAGSGGDIPENNIEALIAAQNTYPEASALVMIADNLAPVRDLKLLKKVRLPVHVIVCGTAGMPVIPDYVRIAYRTGGSIHTMEEDLENVEAIEDNSGLQIGDYKYYYKNGEVIIERR